MWFKNLRIYRFTSEFNIDAQSLNEALEKAAFTPCSKTDPMKMGWVSPVEGGDQYVHSALGNLMICAKKQEKVLPGAVVNEALKERIEEIKLREDRHVGSKERKDIKDEIILELLPKAFSRSSRMYAYIAPKEQLIIVDAASANRAEMLLSLLRSSIGSLPVVPLKCQQLPYKAMTQWLIAGAAPTPFEFGGECQLSDPKEAGSTIRCKHQDLTSTEINNHLQADMIATQLGLSWQGGIEFMLDDQLAIKRIKFADEIYEQAQEADSENVSQQFDTDFSIMSLELSRFIEALIAALGGTSQEQESVEEILARVSKTENTSELEVSF